MSVFGTPQFSAVQAITSTTVSSAALNTATGDLIVVGMRGDTATSFGVTDTAGNTYVPLTLRLSGLVTGKLQWFYCLSAIANAANVVTITGSGGTPVVFDIAVWDYPLSSPVVFDVDTAAQDTSTASTASSPAFNTTGSDEIIHAMITTGGVNGTAFAGGTGAQGTTYSCTAPRGSTGIGSTHRGGACSGSASTPLTGETAVLTVSPATDVAVIAIAFKAAASPTPVVVQNAGNNSFASSPIATPFASNIVAGNCLVLFGWINSLTGTPTVTDTQGNNWVYQAGNAPLSNGGTTTSVCFICTSALSSGANTVTMTFSGGGAGHVMSISEITNTSGTIDAIISGRQISPATPFVTAALTTTQPNSLVLAHFQTDANSSPVIQGGYTAIGHAQNGNQYATDGYKAQTATGSYTAQVDSGGTDVGYILFNIYAGAVPPPPSSGGAVIIIFQ